MDTDTKNNPYLFSVYRDQGRDYFVLGNEDKSRLFFYDLESCELDSVIQFSVEGNNGIGFLGGYFIQNLDSIYLVNRDIKKIALVNGQGIVLNKYSYDYDVNGEPLDRFFLTSSYYRPAEKIGRKLYLYSGPNRFVEKDPVTITFDMDTEEIRRLPFCYPEYPGSDTKVKKYGWESTFSRCFDGKRFIYSFYYDENLYVANIAHDSVCQVPALTRYFNKVHLPSEIYAEPNDFVDIAMYGNLLYDKYRDVYYRVVYPPTPLEDKTIRPLELEAYGRKNFSIIILDKDLKKIGETMFPDYTYNSRVMLILEDGLYISDSHYMNPDFSDDYLSFRKFELVKEQPKE